MILDKLDQSLIREYMNLNSKLKRVTRRLQYVKYCFWEQSFMRSPLDMDANGNPNPIVRFDRQINAIADIESLITETTREISFKRHCWQRYINTLTSQQQRYLVSKYVSQRLLPSNDELDNQALNECNQIEEATAHCFNLECEPAVDVSNNVNKMMNQVLAMIK